MDQPPAAMQKPQYLASSTVATDYRTVVQQLYIAYFGRPADTGGLANFQSQLVALGAPTDIQLLDAAYASNPGIRSLINSFSDSAEAAALYSGDTSSYITAVYVNVLGRIPDAAGKAFWVAEIDSGRLTRARAAFSLMAGALSNTSAQGLVDAKLVQNRVTVGTNFTIALASVARDGYAGDDAAARARSMLWTVNASTDIVAFQTTVTALVRALSCDPSAQSDPDAYGYGSAYGSGAPAPTC